MAFGRPYTHPGSVHTVSPIWTVQNGLGLFGVVTTLKQMAATASEYAGDSRVRELAERIVCEAGAESYRERAAAIHDWLVAHVNYVAQPLGYQELKPPDALIAEAAAHGTYEAVCTDIATLDAALLGSIGIDSRFKAVSFAPSSEYSHVFTQMPLGRDWVSSDPTPIKDENGYTVARLKFGDEAPGIGYFKIRNVR